MFCETTKSWTKALILSYKNNFKKKNASFTSLISRIIRTELHTDEEGKEDRIRCY